MLAVTVTTPVTPAGGFWDAAGVPLNLTAGLLPDTNAVDITLSATTVTGFGNTVVATIVLPAPHGTKTYYNYADKINFFGSTTDPTNAQKNNITLASGFGVDLTGDTTGGSALDWTAKADFTLSRLGVNDVTVTLSGADTLGVTTGAGPSVISGKIDSPTATGAGPNAQISYTTNGVVKISNAGVWGGVDTFDLTIAPAVGATVTGITLDGTIDVENNLALGDVNPIVIAQAIKAGNSVTITTVAGGIGGAVTVNQPITATKGPITITSLDTITTAAAATLTATTGAVALNAATTLSVGGDIAALTGIDLDGLAGVAILATADLVSATNKVDVASTAGKIEVAGTLTATAGAVAIAANLNAVTSGKLTAFSAVTVAANTGIEVGAAVTVTGATPGAGVLSLNTTGGDVSLLAASPLSVADGGVTILAVAGNVATDSGITASKSISITAGQGVTVGDAVTVTGATAGTGQLDIVAKAKNVVVQALSPLVVADGKINVGATAGTLTIEALVKANLAIGLTAGQGITLSNAVDPAAAVTTTALGGTITITNGANLVLLDAPVKATGDSIAVTSLTGGVTIADDVSGLGNVKVTANTALAIGGVAAVTLTSTTATISATSTTAGVTLAPNVVLALPGVASSLDLTAATTVTLPVAVTAGGAITVASPGGFAVAEPLTAKNGGISITAAASSVASTAANASLVAFGDILLTGKTGVSVDRVVTSTAGGVNLTSAGGDVDISATTVLTVPDVTKGTIDVSAGDEFKLGIALTAGNNITVTTGKSFSPTKNFTSATGNVSITVTSGDLDVTGSTITALGAGGDVSLASAVGELKVAMANVLASGNVTLLDSTGLVAVPGPLTIGGDLTIKTGSAWTPTGGFNSLTGDISVTAAGPIDVSGVALAAALGSITLASTTGFVKVGATPNLLTVDPAAGSITLTAATSVDLGQPLTAGDTITITAVSPLAPTFALTATTGDVNLTSTGGSVAVSAAVFAGDSIAITGVGAVTAATGAPLTAIAGGVALTSTGAAVTVDDTIVAAAKISLTAATKVLHTAVLVGGDIELTSTLATPGAGVAIGADLSATGTIALTAATVIGDATLASPIATKVQADVLTATFAGAASLKFSNPLNDVNALSIVLPSGINVDFIDIDDLTVTALSSATGAVSLTAAGFLTVTGAIGTPTTLTGITLVAGGAVSVTTGGSLEAGLAPGGVTVTSTANTVTIEGNVTAAKGSITISSGGGPTGVTIGTTGVPTTVFALDDITLTGAANVSVLGTAPSTVSSVTGDILLTSGGTVTVEASMKATAGKVDVDAVGDVTLTGATILAGNPAPGLGDVTITSKTGNVTSSAAIDAPACSILISTGGKVDFTGGSLGAALTYAAGPPAVGLVSIQGALGVTVTVNPTITAGRLDIDSGSVLPIAFTAPGNSVDTLRVLTKGDFTYSQTAGPLEITDFAPATPTVQVQSTGGSVTISATAGLRVVDGIKWNSTLSLFGGDVAGVEFVPTSTGDNIPPPFAGTLRDMLGYVNANTKLNSAGTANALMEVVFDEPSSPISLGGSIALTSTLPAITKRITLDGSLLPPAPGISIGGIVGIDGTLAGANATCLSLGAGSGGSTLRDAAIHGFGGSGIAVATADNHLTGLLVGLDRTGALDGNGLGIAISGAGAARNAIGIRVAGDLGNFVSANGGSGIQISGGASYNLIYGNTIGLDTGGNPAGNASGVSIEGGIGNRVGSATTLFGNTIANSAFAGVRALDVLGSSVEYGVQVVGNAIANNGGAGIAISGGGRNLVGGTGLGAGNQVTGNLDGIRLDSSKLRATSANVVVGNTVDGNGRDGIRIVSGFNNRVNANDVSNNPEAGIRLLGATVSATQAANRVVNNTLTGNGGTSPTGLDGGIVITNSTGQVVGLERTGAAAANTVLASAGSGIVISDARSTGNTVASNVVDGSNFHGIVVSGSLANSILGNTSTNNVKSGIAVLDSISTTAAAGNRVFGNFVSANGVGIQVSGGKFHAIGGTLASEGNAVFSNLGSGIEVSLSPISGPAASVTIRNNRIGVNGSTSAGNGGYGIRIEGSSATVVDFANLVRNNVAGGIRVVGGSGTTIGSAVAGRGNTISGNGQAGAGNGIDVVEPASGTLPLAVTVAGNVIQTNAGHGILVQGGKASGVVIGRAPSVTVPNGTGNTITDNGGAGIRVDAAQNVTMIGNSIAANGSLPIVLANGANGGVTAPTLTSLTPRVVTQPRPQWDVKGTVSGTAGQQRFVDLYMDLAAGGQGYMGRVLVVIGAGGVGSFRVIVNGPAGGVGAAGIRATATVASGGTLFGSTSAFSA